MILGGQHARYLPKECYFKETGTAESALLIEKGDGGGAVQVINEAMPEQLQLGILSRALTRLCS